MPYAVFVFLHVCQYGRSSRVFRGQTNCANWKV